MSPLPIGHYTVSKVFGKAMGYSYAHQYDMQLVCVRIGNLNPDRDQPEHPHHLSHSDCVEVFAKAITHPGMIRFEVVFGVSGSNWPLYDLNHGRQTIGYCPEDYSEIPEKDWER